MVVLPDVLPLVLPLPEVERLRRLRFESDILPRRPLVLLPLVLMLPEVLP